MPGLEPGDPPRSFHSLTNAERALVEKKRLSGLLISYKHVYNNMCENVVTLLGP
jgi:hypothetical protein